MDWKKFGRALLFPHMAVPLVLLPVATVLLVYSMVFTGEDSAIAYISYVLAAYTLTIWCLRIPFLIRFFKKFKDENKYAHRWLTDTHLRVNVSLYGSLLWNAAYQEHQPGKQIEDNGRKLREEDTDPLYQGDCHNQRQHQQLND